MSPSPYVPASVAPHSSGWPSGTVTFLYTDVKDSTKLAGTLLDWDYQPILEQFTALLCRETEANRGSVFNFKGDGIIGVFWSVGEAIDAAVAVQRALRDQPISVPGGENARLQMRMGIHRSYNELNKLGSFPATQPYNYGVQDLNFASRIEKITAADQILLSDTAAFDYRGNATNEQPNGARASGETHTLHQHPYQQLDNIEGQHRVYDLLYDKRGAITPNSAFTPEWYKGEQNRFIPRTDRAEQIMAYFRVPGERDFKWRVVVLRGAGGMGKTRLAVFCAVEMAENFPGGTFFVSLAVSPDAAPLASLEEEIARRIAEAVHLPASEATCAGVVAWAEKQDKPTLLLLDNAESLAGDRITSENVNLFLGNLVKRSPCRLLITSRKVIGPPSVTQEVPLNDGMTGAQARALFLSIAQQKIPGYAITDETAWGGILIATECIPLPLVLAAGWTRRRGLAVIAAGLTAAKKDPEADDFTRRVAAGDFDDVETFRRHIAVFTSIDWSFALLEPHEKNTLPLCGLFDAPFVRDAVSAVRGSGGNTALDGLEEASLVLFDPETDRYRLHNSVRDYAREKFNDRSDAADCRARFVQFYRELFTASEDIGVPANNERLRNEWPNLQAAHRFAIAQNDYDAARHLLRTYDFALAQGHMAAWKEMVEATQTAFTPEEGVSPEEDYRFADLQVLQGMAWSDLPTGDRAQNLQNAIDCYNAALRVYTEKDFRVDWAMTQNNLGIVWKNLPTGDRAQNLQNAIDCYNAALRVRTEKDFRVDWAATQNNLGNAWSDLPTGDRAQNLQNAIDCYNAALRVRTEKDFRVDWAATQNNLGTAWSDLPTGDRAENLQNAIDCYNAALRVRTEKDFRVQWAGTQNNLGNAWLNLPTGDRAQNLQNAIDCYNAALRVRTEKDFRVDWAGTQNNLGTAWSDLPTGDRAENLQNAIDCYNAALRVYTEKDFRVQWAGTQNNLGTAWSDLPTGDRAENLQNAIDCYNAALRVYTEKDFRVQWATTQFNIGLAYEAKGDRKTACQHLREARRAWIACGHTYYVAAADNALQEMGCDAAAV